MYNRNAAYDLSLFKGKSEKGKLIKLNVDKLKRVRAWNAQLSLVFTGMMFCGSVALGVSTFIMGQAQLAECTEEITQLSKKCQENEGVYTQLCMKKKCEISKDGLAERIENQYNMRKNSTVEYINVMNCNKAEKNSSGGMFENVKRHWNNLFGV